jgi:hypothetical protein
MYVFGGTPSHDICGLLNSPNLDCVHFTPAAAGAGFGKLKSDSSWLARSDDCKGDVRWKVDARY